MGCFFGPLDAGDCIKGAGDLRLNVAHGVFLSVFQISVRLKLNEQREAHR